jgi:hypothetical protein
MKEGDKYLPDEEFCVHPDIKETMKNYKGDRRIFGKLFKQRDEQLEGGEPFWNTDHDVEMKETAEQRTLQASMEGWVYPSKKK